MFSSLFAQNFKSFAALEASFIKAKGKAKHAVVIYGENGAGKSNLCHAFEFLKDSMNTLFHAKITNDFFLPKEDKILFDNGSEMEELVLWDHPGAFKQLVYQNRMIYAEGPSVLKFNFLLNHKEGYYQMIFDNQGLLEETLYYQMDKSRGTHFTITRDRLSSKLSKSIFKTQELRDNLELLIEQYWGKHTLLAILKLEMFQKNSDYFKKRIHPNFFTVYDFLDNIITVNDNGDVEASKKHFQSLDFTINGVIHEKKKKELSLRENALKRILPNIFSDVKGVFYRIEEIEQKNALRYELFFEKWIEGKIRRISVADESSGTKKVLQLLMPLLEANLGSTVIIDEADTGIHDTLFNELVTKAIEGAKGQLIMTTHNTLLLNELPADTVYLLRVDAQGKRTFDNLSSLERVYPNHNVRERYLSGIYGGVPYIGYIDFEEIENCLEE